MKKFIINLLIKSIRMIIGDDYKLLTQTTIKLVGDTPVMINAVLTSDIYAYYLKKSIPAIIYNCRIKAQNYKNYTVFNARL